MAAPDSKPGEVAVQMQPLLQDSNAPVLDPAAPVPASSAPLSAESLQRIEVLRNYSKFYLDYKAPNCYGQILGGESGDVLFKLDRNQTRGMFSPSNRYRITDSVINFLHPDGKIMFKSMRNQFESRVETGDIALGSVSGECCGCGRSFVVSTTSSELVFNLDPVGLCAGCCCSCVNSCFLREYMIYNQRTDQKIGTIKCGEKIEIEIEHGLSVEAKALLVAAAVVIFELYFAPCFGNVGEMGSRYIFACTLIFMPTLIMIGIIIFKLLMEEEEQ